MNNDIIFSTSANSLAEEAKANACAYFETHDVLRREDISSFIAVINCGEIWSTEEERNRLWTFIAKDQTTDEATFESVMNFLNDFFNADVNDVSLDEAEPNLNISALTNNKEILPNGPAENFINGIDNKNLLLSIKMINEIFFDKKNELITINAEAIANKIKERYSFIMIERSDLDKYLKNICGNDGTADYDAISKVDDIINHRLTNGNCGLGENCLISNLFPIPTTIDLIITKLKSFDKVELDYMNAMKDFAKNTVLCDILCNSFATLIKSKSNLYSSISNSNLLKENLALHSHIKSLTSQFDKISKANGESKDDVEFTFSPLKRKSLSTSKLVEGSPDQTSKPQISNEDFIKCLTYNSQNTTQGQNQNNQNSKHIHLGSAMTYDLLCHRRKTETEINKHKRINKSQNYLHFNGTCIDDLQSRKDSARVDDFSTSRYDLFSVKDTSNNEKFLLETTNLNDTANNNDNESKHKGTFHFNINSLIDGDFNEQNELPIPIQEEQFPKDGTVKKMYSKHNNSIKEEEEGEKEKIKNDSERQSVVPSISRQDSSGGNKNLTASNFNAVNSSATVLEESNFAFYGGYERDNMISSEAPNHKNFYDFLNIRHSKRILALLKKNRDLYVQNELFSGYVNYVIGEKFKKEKMILIITALHFFLIEPNSFQCRIKVSRKMLSYIDVASKNYNILVIHFETGVDLILESYKRIEILYYLRDLYSHRKFGKPRFRYPKNPVIKRANEISVMIPISSNKNFIKTPNFENAIKVDYLYEYVDSFLSCKFEEKLVVLCSIGLLVFNDVGKPPKEIIPVIGAKIKTVKVRSGEKFFYCFKLRINKKRSVIFGETNQDNIKGWIRELQRLQGMYEVKMKGVEINVKTNPNNTFPIQCGNSSINNINYTSNNNQYYPFSNNNNLTSYSGVNKTK